MAKGPFPKTVDKPLDTLNSTVPKFHVDLLTKAFVPVSPGQEEFRVDCRILRIEPGAMDRYHFHKQTVNLFTVIEGETDVILNDARVHLNYGESVLVDVLDKHAYCNDSGSPCLLTETRLNMADGDLFFCDEQEPEGTPATRFSDVF
ncbi:MAG: cupin domain-containing protein [Lentisphaeria bacterium]|jgi:oxalate decarboxylase/phosphoglucose isomerase-like protein (cupin superfamily)|nr:cupin domain-containing protein [Lentisphaeria bacterium]MDP7741098.1 cupin domain-containing protein [Lentisphaeria bacterium]